ncbi:phage tail protein [Citrobacter freundii]|uniref:phage tail protein n=1 Tax=Citrobacter freundii TaxID=546 RepID=UPI003F9B01D1
MTAKYFAILTNQGAARLANAAALGTKLNLTQMAVGDANGALPTPDPAQTKLINQKRIAPLNLLTVDPTNSSQIIAEQIIPENEGGFWIREIGLYDDDGILIAVANCPETYKPQLQEGSGRTQTIRMILIVSSTLAITLKIDPSVVLATRQYVDDRIIEVKSYVDSKFTAHEQSRNHPDATTADKGFVQLNSSVTSESEAQAATPKAVKIAMDNANARLAKERNLADLPNPALARQSLQLGDSATKNTGTTAGTVAAGDDARISGAMQKSQNGGDIPDVAQFVQRLGLQFFKSAPSELSDAFTSVLSPDEKLRIVLANSGEWGVQDSQGNAVALPVSRGGTGATDVAGALRRLGLDYGSLLPVGVPIPWVFATPPEGFLKYNGASFDKALYPKLAQIFPSGKLLDLRGVFIRGWDDGKGIDAGRAILTQQQDAQQNITGMVSDVTVGVNAAGTGAFSLVDLTTSGIAAGALNSFYQKHIYLDSSRVVRTATENRPVNIAFNYIVRAA